MFQPRNLKIIAEPTNDKQHFHLIIIQLVINTQPIVSNNLEQNI